MARLHLFALAPSLAFFALICTSLILSRPSDPMLPFETHACRLPCFLGVTPGETLYTEATKTYNDTLMPLSHGRGYEFTGDGFNTPIWVTFVHDAQQPKLEELIVGVENSNVNLSTLGHFFAVGYEPRQVFRSNSSPRNSVTLLIVLERGDNFVTVIARSEDKVDHTAHVRFISVMSAESQDVRLQDLRLTMSFRREIGWHGYRPVDVYWNAEPLN